MPPEKQGKSALPTVAKLFVFSCIVGAGAVLFWQGEAVKQLFSPSIEVREFEVPPLPTPAQQETVDRPAGRKPGARPKSATGKPAVGKKAAQVIRKADGPPGSLLVTCQPACEIFVDGEPASAGVEMTLRSGSHELVAHERDGDEVQRRRVLVAPGRLRHVSVEFASKGVIKDFFGGLEGTEEW